MSLISFFLWLVIPMEAKYILLVLGANPH
jgi:hypothetical protein